jgi:hypothetical protein
MFQFRIGVPLCLLELLQELRCVLADLLPIHDVGNIEVLGDDPMSGIVSIFVDDQIQEALHRGGSCGTVVRNDDE